MNQIMTGSREEASVGPLNLSQGCERERKTLLGARVEDVLAVGQPAYMAPLSGPAHHAVLLANGQPVLVPLGYHHRPAPPNDDITATTPSTEASPEGSEAPPYPPEGPERSPAPGAAQPATAPPPGPSHFTKGAIIQLATGELKRVEDLRTQDFLRSAEASGGLRIDSSTVADIGRSPRPGLVALSFAVGERRCRVAVDVPPEHPFFVFGQGWSSCSPDGTARLYGLHCQRLQAGDVCVSIARQSAHNPPPSAPMGPPPPQHPRLAEAPPRPEGNRSGYHLHREGPQRAGAFAPAAAHRRWSAPGVQKYELKSDEAARPYPSPPSPASIAASRPSFIPQEVKLSIEGRSNAGK